MNLTNKTILITGASRGLGKELALYSANQKARLILVSNERENLKEVAKQCETLTEDVMYEVVDFNDSMQLDKFIEGCGDTEIDILINNAAVGIYDPIQTISQENWDLVMNVNITAVFKLTKGLLNSVRRSQGGLIINIGSKSGLSSYGGRIAYNTSKFALRGLSLVLAENLENENIGVKLFTLGSMKTEFGEESIKERNEKEESGKKYLEPKEVAERIFNSLDSEEVEIEIYP